LPEALLVQCPSPSPSPSQESKPKGLARATRLPDDWVMPDEYGNWALEQKPEWENDHVLRVAADFKDYWIAVAGVKGTKLDWLATWRKWVRNTNLKKP